MTQQSTEQQSADESRQSEPHGDDGQQREREQQQSQQSQQSDGESTDDGESHDEQSKSTDWKAEARKWEKQAKANKDAARRLSELERANESEQQRLQRERDEARTEAESSGVELARMRAAVKYGLDEDDLDLLGNGKPDEIDERAKRLADRLGKKSKPATRRPSESLGGGSDPEREPEETDIRKLGARMFQH